MFDISFSELMLIGVIALIVIGPERLPKVARTVGLLLGRAQRYVNDVKTDIRKEMDAAEIGNLKDQMQEAANSVKSSVEDTSKAWRAPIDEAQDALKQASDSVKTLAESARTMPNSTEPATPASSEAAAPASSNEAAEPEAAQAPLPSAPWGEASDNEADAVVVDDRTLPLPGFEREPTAANAADPAPTSKGTQP